MQKGQASTFDSPQVRFLLRMPLPRSYTNYLGRKLFRFLLTVQGIGAFALITLGVMRSKFGVARRVVHPRIFHEISRSGLRLLPMSEVMIQEVKVVTTGFAPEFGQTMGMVFNAVTPSGTNAFHGQASYLFRRRDFSAFPFFFGCTTIAADCGPPAENAVKPETKVDTGTANVGGPIVKNKLFFYG